VWHSRSDDGPGRSGSAKFYDGLARDYEVVYGGEWERAVGQQGDALDRLIRTSIPDARSVLDCACGIGTQVIGLADRGYRVVGTDLSRGAIDQARQQARRFGVDAAFAVADFRDLSAIEGRFDVVVCCDNALAHLLNPADVITAIKQMHGKLNPAGLVIVTMRDFDRALRERPSIAALVVLIGPPRRILVRLHDWHEERPLYTVRLIVLTERQDGWDVTEHTSHLRAITRAEPDEAASAAGLGDVRWHSELPVVGDQQVMTARG
jgi:SAM-dependent methyltransferase